MRPLFCAALVELMLLVTVASVEDASSSTSVFEMGHLVDEAEAFSQGVHQTATQTALQRVQAMKNALATKILNKEIQKLPYTETELGEGMAVATLKDDAAPQYDHFKTLAKTIQGQMDDMRKKLLGAETSTTGANKKEMQARKDAADLREQLRKAIKHKKPEGQDKLISKLKEDVASLRKSVQQKKEEVAVTQKNAKKRLTDLRTYFDTTLEQNKDELTQQREDDALALKQYKQDIESSWYVNTTKLGKQRKALEHANNTINDLENTLKDKDRTHKEVEAGLKAEFEASERDLIEEMKGKLKKQTQATVGEQQKESWDKEEVVEAKKKAKEDNFAMSNAVRQNQDLEATESVEAAKLVSLKNKEEAELEQAKKMENQLKLKRDLEKVKENQAETKVSATKAEATIKSKETTKEASDSVEKAKAAAKHKLEEMHRKVQSLKEKFASTEHVLEAKQQERLAETRASADVQIDKAEERKGFIETQEQAVETKSNDMKEKLGFKEQELGRANKKIKEMEESQTKLEDEFKAQAAKDAERISKRAGARTMANAEKQEVESADTKLLMKEAELQKAEKRANELVKDDDALQKKADDLQEKLRHAQYRAFQEKKKSHALQMKVATVKLVSTMAQKTAKHNEELGEANSQKAGPMEMKYKYQVKVAEALKQQVATEQSKVALQYSKNQHWEAKAQKFKQAMYAAEAHARRIAARVRKKWAMKLINEQDVHTKTLLKLKHFIALRQAKHDAQVNKLRNAEENANAKADKAQSKESNQEEITKYIASIVGEQDVKSKVLRKYMMHMSKVRHKYNTKLGSEWKTEIKRLNKKLEQYTNGRVIAKYKTQIRELKHQLKASSEQKTIETHVKRSQELDIQTLLGAAIKEATKGSEKRSEEENRHRVDAAVAAVVRTVHAADSLKGKALAKKSDKELDAAKSPAAKMQRTIQPDKKESRVLNTEEGFNMKSSVDQKADTGTETPIDSDGSLQRVMM